LRLCGFFRVSSIQQWSVPIFVDMEPEVVAAGIVKKRTFKKFSFRGVDLDALLDMSIEDLVKHFSSRIRRRLPSFFEPNKSFCLIGFVRLMMCFVVFKGFLED